jgi:hypothetical protein
LPLAVASALGVPLDVVERSVRFPEPPSAIETPPVAVRSEMDERLDVAFGEERPAVDDGPAPLPWGEREVLGPVLVVGAALSVRKLRRPESWRAPVFVRDDLAWPPVASEADQWRVVPVTDGSAWARTPLREVVLWGERVLVDDGRRVFCPMCRKLVGVAELGRDLFRGRDDVLGGGIPSHRLGLPPVRAVLG